MIPDPEHPNSSTEPSDPASPHAGSPHNEDKYRAETDSASTRHSQLEHSTGLPEKLGRYDIRGLLGAGGHAVVYLAEDTQRQHVVALKVPLSSRLLNPQARRRFLSEALLAARLEHPHIVPAYDAGEEAAMPYIAYAYCSGPTLAGWIRSHGPCDARAAAGIVARLADAVAYSHEQGVLHRDIKPGNVLLFPLPDGEAAAFPWHPRLTDFGLAKVLEASVAETRTSQIIGTPIYLAPEQLNFAELEQDEKTAGRKLDLYALGGLLYELVAGKPLLGGTTLAAILDAMQENDREKLRSIRPRLPQSFCRICEQALSRRPCDRYASVADLRDDLERFLGSEPVKARSVGRVRKFSRALQAPARINETAGFVCLSHAAMLLWIIASPTAILAGLPFTAGVTMDDVVPEIFPLMALHSLTLGAGWQIGQRKQWAAVFSILSNGLLCLFVLMVLLGWISPPFPTLYQNPRKLNLMFLLLFCLFFLQTILSGCAWRAMTLLRRQPA